MPRDFEELDYRQTALGELTLRRRKDLMLNATAFEVKLNDEFLMSSLFTVGEIALARLALERGVERNPRVVVGGLGLGYTAAAVLEDASVESLLVVEALTPVIDWHRQGLLPLGTKLTSDPRCRVVEGDFFALCQSPDGLDPQSGNQTFDLIVLDIDHSPRHLLNDSHKVFYEIDGLRQLSRHLRPEGVFAMWSNDPVDHDFMTRLRAVFPEVESEKVTFDNPYTGALASCTIYLAYAKPG